MSLSLSQHALTTLAAVKAELRIPENQTSEDANLCRLINGASDAIRRHCQRDFARSTVTEELRGSGTHSLLLALTPIVQVDFVRIGDEEVDSDRYRVDQGSGLLELIHRKWPERDCGIIEVTYVGGYVTPNQAESGGLERDLPYDIEQACIITTSTQFRHMGQPADVRSIWVEQLRVEFAEGGRPGLPPVAASLLEPYVRWA